MGGSEDFQVLIGGESRFGSRMRLRARPLRLVWDRMSAAASSAGFSCFCSRSVSSVTMTGLMRHGAERRNEKGLFFAMWTWRGVGEMRTVRSVIVVVGGGQEMLAALWWLGSLSWHSTPH